MKKSGLMLVAVAIVAMVAQDGVACGPLGRLRARLFGGCNGGGQRFQQDSAPQPDNGQQQQQQPFDNTNPNDDTVKYGRVGAAMIPGVNCPCVQNGGVCPCATPGQAQAGFVPTWAVPVNPYPPVPMATTPVAAAAVGAAVADDILSPPGVGIAAVEKRTAVLEAKVAALESRLAAIQAPAVTQRSTVYLSGAAPYPQAAPAMSPYQPIQMSQPLPTFAPRVYRLQGSACGPNGCPRQ